MLCGVYREVPSTVPGIACFWTRTADADGEVRILPDACWDLVSRDGELSLVGPDTRAWISRLRRGDTISGVRFSPGSGTALGLPLATIRDQRTKGPGHLVHAGRPFGPGLIGQAVRMVVERPPDAAVVEAVRRLRDPRARVGGLADDLGLSERQLRRRFDVAVGYGPKTLQRVLRFRRFLAIDEPDLAARAFAAGYADQAHATHEVRELAGLTPAVLLAAQ